MYEQITQALRQAEKAAQNIVATSLSAGDYDRARRVVDYAQSIKALCETVEGDDVTPVAWSRADRAGFASQRSVAKRVSPDADRPYPHFFIDGDRMVKVGLSRPEADSPHYRHETPRQVFEYVVDGVRQMTHDGAPWPIRTLESMLAERGMPTYHAYNVVAAARDAGLVKQVGRGLYRVAAPVPPQAWWDYMENLWPLENLDDEAVRRSDGDE